MQPSTMTMDIAMSTVIEHSSGMLPSLPQTAMTRSVFSHDLIASYLNTDYQINIHNELICLRINHYSQPLAHLLKATQQPSGAIISAYNPQSKLQNDRNNTRAHQLLQHDLCNLGYAIIESLHKDSVEQWPIEKGFLAIGLNLNDARSIGRRFNQNAIVWINSDAIPRLILLN